MGKGVKIGRTHVETRLLNLFLSIRTNIYVKVHTIDKCLSLE